MELPEAFIALVFWVPEGDKSTNWVLIEDDPWAVPTYRREVYVRARAR